MNKTQAKKYLTAIKASKIRHLTCEALSRSVGIYPEIIAENLSFFEPMLPMDLSFNLRDLVSSIEQYILEQSQSKPKVERKVVNFKELSEFKSVGDFVYKKMTINGLVSRNASLKEEDLRILKKLIERELKPSKPKGKKKSK